MFKIVTADDEHMVKRGLKKIIESCGPEFTVIGEASDGHEAIELVEQHRPHLVITDICMPVMDGIDLIKEVRNKKYPVGFIVLSGYNDFAYAQQALRYDAADYLLKPMKPEEVQKALHSAYRTHLDTQQLNQARSSCLWRCTALSEQLVQQLWQLNVKEAALLGEEIYAHISSEALPLHLRKQILADVLAFIDLKLADKGIRQDRQLFSQIVEDATEMSELKHGFMKLLETWAGDIRQGRNLGQRNNIRRALDYIEHHILDSDLSLWRAAEHSCMSPAYLSKLFKEEVGLNFIAYVTNLRIEKAKAMLMDPLVKTYEVCHAVGFVDYPHFAKTFKKVTGVSPKEYRDACTNSGF